ncbi:MarR family winged helix-turn-helix transcriptional regulator [Geodermatophilus sp. CPCC 206100]|uniref:MarR family winged helix-turn-helix transcriptional regulator n=1 Tax=Geodermatophilus sp. CPCC 206100 TaxID=3020054 RepID=UPI003B00FACC
MDPVNRRARRLPAGDGDGNGAPAGAVERSVPEHPRSPAGATSDGAPVAGGDILPLHGTLGHLVRRAQQVHTALFTEELDGHLTGPQYAVLSALAAGAPLSQREVGRLASLDKSTTADIVSRLERNGWLRRRRSPQDARRNLLELTGSSRAALESVTGKVARVQERLLAVLDEADRGSFVDLLGRVAYRGRLPDPESPDAAAPGTAPALGLTTTPGHLLRRVEQVHASLWGEHVGGLITPSQYAILSALYGRPSMNQVTAGELASLDKSSTADIVARLERRGLVTVARDAGDGRQKVLSLAPDVRETHLQLTERVQRVQAALAEPLLDGELGTLVGWLDRVAFRDAGSS